MKTLRYTAGAKDVGQRMDTVLAAAFPELTRSYVQQLAANGQVLCNGRTAAKSARLAAGDALCVSVPDAQPVPVAAQEIPLEILYEDDVLLVVNKPRGMVVHPAPGNPDGTLVNALLFHCSGRLSGINGELRPGIVHRIDKDTSGLLVVAKENAAHAALSQQFAAHSITRVYHTIVYGGFSADDGMVRFSGFTHLSVRLKTGRTHQIRVHLASIGHPVAGDAVYGPKKALTWLNGQCLHAKMLGFQHPVTGDYLEFDSPLPDYFTAFLSRLEKER